MSSVGEKEMGENTNRNVRYKVTAVATAKSLQSCPTLCDPIDGSPPGCPIPGILQARTLDILTHIYGIYKDGNDDPICETAEETQI